MVLESSVEEFVSRFAEFAATGVLYPQPEGSPLMEFTAGGRVLYLFDRTGPYGVRPGEARVLVHGVTEQFELLSAPDESPDELPDELEEALNPLGVSRLEGVGRVLQASRGFCVVQARLPLVLGSFTKLPASRPGDWVRFSTLPPLHGFLV